MCCCHYHIELVELKIGLNNMHSKIDSIHANCAGRCVDVCYPIDVQDVGNCCANQITFARLVDLSNFIICPKPIGDKLHKQDCLMGDFSLCGINTLNIYATKKLLCVSRMMQWQQYAKVFIGQKDNGDDQKMMQLQYMDTPTFKPLDYLHPKIEKNYHP